MNTNLNTTVKPEPNPFRDGASLALAALLLLPASSALADSYWQGGTSDFNNPASWSSGIVPVGINGGNANADNDSGSNNVVLIQPGDPIWNPWDIRAGDGINASGSFLQTGSTNNIGGWFRLADSTGSAGYYTLSNGVVNAKLESHVGEVGVGYLKIAGGTYNAIGFNLAMGDGDFGPSGSTPEGTLEMLGGTINSASEIWFGEAGNDISRVGTGHLIIHGGTINANNWFVLGRFGGIGDAIMDGGTINKGPGGNVQFGVGTYNSGTIGAVATFNQSGGTFNCQSEYQISTDNNLTIATNNISGTAVLNVGSWLAVGRFGGMGTLNLSGGAVTKYSGNGNVTIASGSSVGVINQSGGTFTNTDAQTWVAENNLGTWNLNGGSAVLGVIHLTQNQGASGTFNLNGGDLTATEITDNGGSGTINFNGGTLHAGVNSVTFMHDLNGGAYVQAGGANINTEGYDITISQALADGGGGGLTKNGKGTLTFTGANSYSGATLVNQGTLITSPANLANGDLTIADNAGFGVGNLGARDAQVTTANLNLGTSAGATLNFDLGSFGNPDSGFAPLNVSGNLAATGSIVINITDGSPQLGRFPLIKYGTKSGSGIYTLGTLPTGLVASIVNDTANNSIELDVTGIAVDDWSGAVNGNWDINGTANWTDAGTGLPKKYFDGDAVVFNDAASNTVVTLNTTVLPGSVAIINNSSNYTLVGSGKIGGGIGLNKQGSAAFTIGNTNSYTGATILAGGLVVVSNLANGGVSSAIGASSANPTNLVLGGGTLSYAGPDITINRGYNLQYNYASNGVPTPLSTALDLQGNLTLKGRVTAASLTSFVKTGPGTLTYAGSVTNELSGGAFPGYISDAGTLVFDGSSGGQTNHSQNEFWLGSSPNSGADLILSNTVLRVDSWFAMGRGNGSSGFVTTATLTNSTLYCGNFSMGYWAGRPNNLAIQTFTLNNSKLIDTGAFNISESAGSSATIYINGNSVVNEYGPFLPGMQSGASGTVVMADSAILTNTQWASIGANGTGSLTMKDNSLFAENSDFNLGDYGAAGTTGTLTIQDNAQIILTGGGSVYVGKTAGAIGTVTQTGGTINARKAGVFQLAQQAGSVGTWLQSGGTTYGGGWVSIGRGAASGDTSPTGLLVVSGGLFDQSSAGNGLIVGEQGTGTLTITNTGVVVSEADTTGIGVAIGWNQGVGTVNLDDGGTLVANYVQNGSGSGTFNFNGGVLRAGPAARLNFMAGLTAANVLAGAIIDASTNTIDIAQALLDGGMGGGLTKNGTGTLLLDGANTYSGTTTVSAGALGGIGTLASSLAVQSGGMLAIGTSIGALTVNNTVNLAGGSKTVMKVSKAAATNDQVLGVSSMTYGGTLVLTNMAGNLAANDSFRLFVAGSYHGAFTNVVSETPGQIVTWDVSQLGGNGTVKVATAVQSQVTITPVVSGTNLTLSWPAGQTGATLQEQINPLTVGISTNWVIVPGSSTTNQMTFPIIPTNGTVFFRLVF
jgi:autotransporter-associated beta strand protein